MLKWIQTSIIKIATTLIPLLIIAPQVNAELTAQLYGGNGFTQKHNASVNLPDANITGTHEALTFDAAAIVGERYIQQQYCCPWHHSWKNGWESAF